MLWSNEYSGQREFGSVKHSNILRANRETYKPPFRKPCTRDLYHNREHTTYLMQFAHPDHKRHMMHFLSFSPRHSLPLTHRLANVLLPRQQIALDRKHLPTHTGRKPIHLPRILLHLPRIQQNLQPTRLRRQLKQARPLILRQWRLLRRDSRLILRLSLLLPRRDLGLLPRERALVVLVVIQLVLVGLDGVEEEVAGFLEERVDAQIEGVEVGC